MNEASIKRLMYVLRRQEQRRLEMTHKLISENHGSMIVANPIVARQMKLRYPRATYKHWLVLHLISYVSLRTKQIIGQPYFIFELANRWVAIESKWKKLSYFHYWEKMGVITRDTKIKKILTDGRHPWGKMIRKSPYYVNREVLSMVLADYAEELSAFYMNADLDLEQTPRFIPLNYDQYDRNNKFARKRTERSYQRKDSDQEITTTYSGIDTSFIKRADNRDYIRNPLYNKSARDSSGSSGDDDGSSESQ